MTHEDFNYGMTLLKDCYGEKYYSKARIKIFWDHLKKQPGYLFREACTDLAANEKYAPLLEKIVVEMGKRARRNQMALTHQPDDLPDHLIFPVENVTEEWIDNTNKKLLASDSGFNAQGAKKIMMVVVDQIKKRKARECRNQSHS